MLVLSREQVRRLDRLAITELGIPGIVLMENAARSVADHALDLAERTLALAPEDCPFAVICGGGNNGGDGYAVARHLHNAGAPVTIFAAVDPALLKDDAATQAKIALNMGLHIHSITDVAQLEDAGTEMEQHRVLVDALLGTGFSGELRPHFASVIRRMNALRAQERKIVAIDVPSGMDCDTGAPSTQTVRADLTVTLVAEKRGFNNITAKSYLGRVVVGEIGTPPELLERV